MNTDHLSSIPHELYCVLAPNMSVGDVVNLSRTCKHIHDIIIADFDKYTYIIASKSDINILGREYIADNKMYTSYQRGKSFQEENANLYDPDIKFEIIDSEYILFFDDSKLRTNSPEAIIITINSNLEYNVYEFQQEVDENNEYMSMYSEWDDDDVDIQILFGDNKYNTIDEIKLNQRIIINHMDYLKVIYRSLLCYPLRSTEC